MSLPIVRPSFPRLGDFATEFNRCLQTGTVTNGGEYVRQFEKRLSEALAVPTICFNSGQSVLIAMLMAADVQGGEVICPSFTFAGTPHAIVMAGSTPVFADIDAESLCLDPADVERRITPRTKAILGVDPYGICCEYEVLADLVKGTDIKFLVDSAPAFGSMDGGQLTGGNADGQIFSFHATKPFSTMEGGALCSHDDVLLERARAIRNFGQSDIIEPCVGFNGKMMEVCALIGLKQLETFDGRARSRVESASRLRQALDGIHGLHVVRAPLGQSPIWTYRPVAILPSFGRSRDDVLAELHKRGIMARKYYGACHLLPCYASHRVELPHTEEVAEQIIALPVYDEMTRAEIQQIAVSFRELRGVA